MNASAIAPTRIIDSHTAGEPTRLVVAGGPELGRGSMADRRARMAREHDAWRRALVNEPRGNDVIVGALLCEPAQPENDCGVIFFNNAGYLGMCGHGTIGLLASLRYLDRIGPGTLRIETPVGVVRATLHEDGEVSVANVASYRHAAQVAVDVPGRGTVHGDVAWGGNWFFLCADHGVAIAASNVPELRAASQAIAEALKEQGVRAAAGAEIDHVELLGPARDERHHARSFVLCPGGAYDRSPCGTGTSAKLACLAAEGVLAPGQTWYQESVVGSVFAGHYEPGPAAADGGATILPTIRGRAYVTLDAQVVFDPRDPFQWGLTA